MQSTTHFLRCIVVALAPFVFSPTSLAAGLGEATTPQEVLAAVVDPNADGRVTDGEAKGAIQRVRIVANAKAAKPSAKVTPEQLREAFDDDQSGLVDTDEARIHIAAARLEIDPLAKRAEAAVAQIDTNGDDNADGTELQTFLQGKGKVGQFLAASTLKIFRSLDTDRDKCVSTMEAVTRADAFLRFAVTFECGANADPKVWTKALWMVSVLDGNVDNQISNTEAMPARTLSQVFTKIDTNSDTAVSTAELYSYVDREREAIARETQRGKTCPICADRARSMSSALQDLIDLR
jgi:Ca2+-binding EF-hand superfamily protein